MVNHSNPATTDMTVVTDQKQVRRRLTTDEASAYLKEKHGLPAEPKTLRNWRALGRGPSCKYLGTKPIYEPDELDRWAEEDALTDVCPTSRKHQQVAA